MPKATLTDISAAATNKEEREHSRSKTLRNGTIIFNSGWSTLSCVILDVSKGGARLRLSDLSVHCPDEFKLRSESTGQTRLCAVVWRRDRDLGVQWVADIGDL